MKGGTTMQVPHTGFDARLAALEDYIDMPTKRAGMTITARLDAQHSLLEALRADMSDLTRRVTNLEDGMGKALHGITEIKNLLTRLVSPTAGHGLNGSSPREEPPP
jgi:ATP phosphoribosyltransferase regulatory subunit HisZ